MPMGLHPIFHRSPESNVENGADVQSLRSAMESVLLTTSAIRLVLMIVSGLASEIHSQASESQTHRPMW
jgi:hypothetical protein